MSKPLNGKIHIKMIDTNTLTQWPCTVCGGKTDKVGVLCEDTFPDPTVRVCEKCIESGDIDGRLRQHAADLAEHIQHVNERIAFLNQLVGRLEIPTFEQWRAREAGWEARMLGDGWKL